MIVGECLQQARVARDRLASALLADVLRGAGEGENAYIRGRIVDAVLLLAETEVGERQEIEDRFGLRCERVLR